MYDIMEVNASEVSGVQDIGKIAESSLYAPRPPSRYRIFILDEAMRLSSEAQNLLLKYFEDCPKTSIWIICTTNPQKILRTLRSRCVYYEIPGLKLDGIKELVERAIRFAGSSLGPHPPDPKLSLKNAGPLIDALAEQGVWNPRFILQAVEKYLAGGSPEQSASVDSVEISVDTLKICRTLVNGNWQGLRTMLRVIPPDESRPVAQAIMGYLTTIILTSDTLQQRAASVEGIHRLSKLGFLDDGMRRPALMAILYDLTQMFSGKKQIVRSRVDDDEGD